MSPYTETLEPSRLIFFYKVVDSRKMLTRCRSEQHFLWLIYVLLKFWVFPLLHQEDFQNLYFGQNNNYSIIIALSSSLNFLQLNIENWSYCQKKNNTKFRKLENIRNIRGETAQCPVSFPEIKLWQ